MSQTAAGRKLGRKPGHRRALLRNLTTELIRHEQIKTTWPKAKECSRLADYLITLAKRDDLVARRGVARDLQDPEAYRKLFDVLIQRYAKRSGGFSRIFRLESRQGDNAEMALLKLIA